MKKWISTLTLICLLFSQTASADLAAVTVEETNAQQEAPLQEIGLEESPPQRPSNDSNLRNWLFAAGSAITLAVACFVVSLNPGSPPASDNYTGNF